MSNQPRQQFRLHERHRQWELRLQDDCAAHGDFYLERGFQAASRLVFSAFSSAMQVRERNMSAYCQKENFKIRKQEENYISASPLFFEIRFLKQI